MATVTAETTEPRRSDSAARRYPPLLFLILAVVIAMAVLPSSLTLPQANPSQTVEIAPVPPEDDTPPPPLGNVDQLSLGGSDTLNGQGANGAGGGGGLLDEAPAELPPLPPAAGTGAGKTKTSKRCVQTKNGLRQTQDIVSPPCSADFTGDNGGTTYQGVTAGEIRLLVYQDGGVISTPTARSSDNRPTDTLLDMDDPPSPNEIGEIITLRAWLKYFNDRFQTYNRRVHGYIYYGGFNREQAGRQADAAAAYSRVKPFATISIAGYGGGADAYNVYMGQKGVLNFGSQQGRPQDFFTQFPKLIWGYPPSIEQQAKVYVDYVCTKVKGKPAVDAGGALKGLPRTYGFISTSDAGFPGSQNLAKAIRTGVEACGIKFDGEGKFPVNGFAVDPLTPNGYATKTMAEFKQKNITTIIWGGGTEANYSQAAFTNQYTPEWFLAGDGQNDAGAYGVNQQQQTWDHAWNIGPVVRVEKLETEICYQEYRSVDTTAADSDVAFFACPIYNDLRQFFTGVQVAGPKLGPTSVDKGYHAIPPVESKDARIPACFYEPNDYTCVKDAQAMFWDSTGQVNSEQQTGCWRMVAGGERHIAGKWPANNIDQDRKPGLICNQYDTSSNINNNP